MEDVKATDGCILLQPPTGSRVRVCRRTQASNMADEYNEIEHVEEVEIHQEKFRRILDKDEQQIIDDFCKEGIDINMLLHDEDGKIYWIEEEEDPRKDCCPDL